MLSTKFVVGLLPILLVAFSKPLPCDDDDHGLQSTDNNNHHCPKGQHWNRQDRCVENGCADYQKWDNESWKCENRCGRGLYWSSNKGECVKHECGKDKKWSYDQWKCVPHCDEKEYFDHDSGHCVRHSCEKNFHYSTSQHQCVPNSRENNSSKDCGDGEVFDKDGNCHRVNVGGNYCPPGQIRKNGKCIDRNTDDTSCPRGYRLKNGHCEPKTNEGNQDYNDNCDDPNKFVNNFGNCVPVKCKDGQHRNAKGFCVGEKDECGPGQILEVNALGLSICVGGGDSSSSSSSSHSNRCGPHEILQVNALGIEVCVSSGSSSSSSNGQGRNGDGNEECKKGQVPIYENGRLVCKDHNVNSARPLSTNNDDDKECGPHQVLKVNALGIKVCVDIGNGGNGRNGGDKDCGPHQVLKLDALGIKVCVDIGSHGSSSDNDENDTKSCPEGQIPVVENGHLVCRKQRTNVSRPTPPSIDDDEVIRPKKHCPPPKVLEVNAAGIEICVNATHDEEDGGEKKCRKGQTLQLNALGIQVCVDINASLSIGKRDTIIDCGEEMVEARTRKDIAVCVSRKDALCQDLEARIVINEMGDIVCIDRVLSS